MNVAVMPAFRPDAYAMSQHVEHLFGGFLDGYQNGLIELAWTDTQPDAAGRYRLRHARLFGTDQIDDLVEEAARLNATPMCNVYIGAALRRPDTPPFGRGEDDDAWVLTALYADLDDPGAAVAAKEIYGATKPTMVVVTGAEPHMRAQIWWRLDEPMADKAEWPAALRGIATALSGDSTVCNPGRVMRLAGSIAWPVKDGRVVEATRVVPLKVPGAPVYAAWHLMGLFPPIEAGSNGTVDTGASEPPRLTNSLGLTGKVTDGRERYMRDTALAVLREYIGENGCVPSPQELFEAAWPQYEREVDFSRPGRGRDELAEKCLYTLQRFERGDIRGMETLEAAVASHRMKKEAWKSADQSGFSPSKPPLPPPAQQDKSIRFRSFLTLLTEEVEEEPDYIEPGFAPPGGFILIAGPPKAQKSFLKQEILVAAATGQSFLCGTFTVPRPLRVFDLQAEMNAKLLRRRAREFPMFSPEEKHLLDINLIVSDRFHMIINEDGVKVATETIKAAFPDAPPDIISIDPMANVFDQENENDNAQVMRFLTGRLEAIRQAVNPLACLLMVHHATKKSAEEIARDPFVAIRGGGALRGYYDSAIVIFRESEEGRARKVHFELRSGESPDPMSVELAGGRFQKANEGSSIDKPMARQILKAIDEAWQKGRPWSPHPRAKVEGAYAVKNISETFSVPPKAAQWLLDQWLKNEVITFQPRAKWKHSAGFQVTGSID